MGIVYLNARASSLEIWPDVLREGERLHIAFLAPRFAGARSGDYEIRVLDERRRTVAKITNRPSRPVGGVVVVEWDGRNERGVRVAAGAYRLCVAKPGTTFALERTIFVGE